MLLILKWVNIYFNPILLYQKIGFPTKTEHKKPTQISKQSKKLSENCNFPAVDEKHAQSHSVKFISTISLHSFILSRKLKISSFISSCFMF